MPISVNDLNKAVNRAQAQLDAGSRAGIQDALSMLLAELTQAQADIAALQAAVTTMRGANVVLGTFNAAAFPSGLEAAGSGAVVITLDSPALGFIEFNA